MSSLQLVQETVYHLEQSIEAHLKEASLDNLIRYYQGLHFVDKKVEELKGETKEEVGERLRQQNLTKYDCVYGTVGITTPKARALDKAAWEKAKERNEKLRQIEQAYLTAKEIYERVQEPYTQSREGWVYIR